MSIAIMSVMERFMVKVLKRKDGCWEWTAARDKDGYGYFQLGKVVKAHRASYILFNGAIPRRHEVMHSCDNPWCVNPRHLTTGTRLQNEKDKTRKGRRPSANKHWKSYFTEAQVKAIYADQRPQAQVARDYGTTQPTVARIKQGLTWATVTGAKSTKPGHFKGAKSYQAKLTPAQVSAIRRSKRSPKELAERYEVSRDVIYDLLAGRTYT